MFIEKKTITLTEEFKTESGKILKKAPVAYEEYGKSNGKVILITHGGLSSMHAAGRYSESDIEAGWWDDLIGPGKVFNTDEYRIICANALGSMYGTCSPLTKNPETGKKYKADFPHITFNDHVRFFKQFLDELGIEKLHLAAGVSMGSMHNLLMAAMYPDFVGGVISVATAGRMPPSGVAMHLYITNSLEMDPAFNNGDYENSEDFATLYSIQQMTRIYYTHERIIKKMCWDVVGEAPEAQIKRVKRINNYLTAGLDEQTKQRDPNCIIRILNAINTYDLGADSVNFETGVMRIQCPVLLVNMNTDQEFPPHWAEEIAAVLNKKNHGQARAKIIDSDWGHVGCLHETEKFKPLFSEFIVELT
jgi:homoserine O-acetyltransferase